MDDYQTSTDTGFDLEAVFEQPQICPSLVEMPASEQQSIQQERKKKKTSHTSAASSSSQNQSDNKDRSLCMLSKIILTKIQQSDSVSMNELANQVVAECAASPEAGKNDKNIRRRVYDCVNVLNAAGVIQKGHGKKDITYCGTDGCAQRAQIQLERAALKKRIEEKRHKLALLRLQKRSFELLIERNSNPSFAGRGHDELAAPFIIISTHPSATIDCEMNDERTDVMFEFSCNFEIVDDNDVVREMFAERTREEGLAVAPLPDPTPPPDYSGIYPPDTMAAGFSPTPELLAAAAAAGIPFANPWNSVMFMPPLTSAPPPMMMPPPPCALPPPPAAASSVAAGPLPVLPPPPTTIAPPSALSSLVMSGTVPGPPLSRSAQQQPPPRAGSGPGTAEGASASTSSSSVSSAPPPPGLVTRTPAPLPPTPLPATTLPPAPLATVPPRPSIPGLSAGMLAPGLAAAQALAYAHAGGRPSPLFGVSAAPPPLGLRPPPAPYAAPPPFAAARLPSVKPLLSAAMPSIFDATAPSALSTSGVRPPSSGLVSPAAAPASSSSSSSHHFGLMQPPPLPPIPRAPT